ncbi:MAG: polysaccharide deacetylase family protein, partial [Sphingomonadales bacterium]
TCGGGFYKVDNILGGACRTPREDSWWFESRRWIPGGQVEGALSPKQVVSTATNKPPGYTYDTPPYEVGGDTTSFKIIKIAWTFDDGPVGKTEAMRKSLGLTHATWYIMFNEIMNNEKKNIEDLKEIQKSGGEIAIHSFHKDDSHVAWFPMSTKGSYRDIEAAMNDLAIFKTYLTGKELKVKFVRLPFGLITELSQYLADQGVYSEEKTKRLTIAKQIIKGAYEGSEVGALKVKTDFEFMKTKINGLGLHLWGGSRNNGREISYQSWEAETSGVPSRADDTTTEVSEARKKQQLSVPAKDKDKAGRFEGIVNKVATGGRSHSLVILAHETTQEDVDAVKVDKDKMEEYATSKKVKIEYYTMSGLYKALRGTEP